MYSKLIAVIYYFLDRIPLIAQFLNIIMGVAVIYLVYKTIIVLFDNKKAGYIGAFIVAVYPTLNLYSVVLLRESVIIFFFALSFLFFSLWIKKGKLKNIILSVIFIFISSIFHGGMFLAGLVYLFLFCFYHPEKKKWRLFDKQLLIGVLITIIYSALFFGFFASKIPNIPIIVYEKAESIFLSYQTKREIKELKENLALQLNETSTEEFIKKIEESISLKEKEIEEKKDEVPKVTKIINKSSSVGVKGRTVYLEEREAESFFDIVWQTPVRTVYFYFAPFPWDVDNYADVVGVINSLFYLILFAFFIKTLFFLWKEDKALFWALILILLVFSGTFAWGTSNYGSAFRHKTKILFLIVIVASYSISLINWKKIKSSLHPLLQTKKK